MKTKLFILLLSLLSAGQALAQERVYEIGGYWYALYSDGAAIASVNNGFKYSGAVRIPATVRYNGRTYSVKWIYHQAFDGCKSLTSITIPNSVKEIGEAAFWGCESLTSVTIPNSVKEIGVSPFAGCTGLTSITVDAGNAYYDSREGCNAIIEKKTNKLVQGCQNTTIPNSVKEIGNYAFWGCEGLEDVTIPNGVTSIGENAFSDCIDLESVTIPASVTSIGESAFGGEVMNIRDVTVLRTDPKGYKAKADVFEGNRMTKATLHVPAGCAAAYRACQPWSRFKNIVEDAQ